MWVSFTGLWKIGLIPQVMSIFTQKIMINMWHEGPVSWGTISKTHEFHPKYGRFSQSFMGNDDNRRNFWIILLCFTRKFQTLRGSKGPSPRASGRRWCCPFDTPSSTESSPHLGPMAGFSGMVMDGIPILDTLRFCGTWMIYCKWCYPLVN